VVDEIGIWSASTDGHLQCYWGHPSLPNGHDTCGKRWAWSTHSRLRSNPAYRRHHQKTRPMGTAHSDGRICLGRSTHASHWQARFAPLQKRIGKQKAIVVIARKLLVVVWNVLSHLAVDRRADVQAFAGSFMTWGARHKLATRLGLSRPEFVRRELDWLGIDHELDTHTYCGRSFSLNPRFPNFLVRGIMPQKVTL
jgi:hypothetical protein